MYAIMFYHKLFFPHLRKHDLPVQLIEYLQQFCEISDFILLSKWYKHQLVIMGYLNCIHSSSVTALHLQHLTHVLIQQVAEVLCSLYQKIKYS